MRRIFQKYENQHSLYSMIKGIFWIILKVFLGMSFYGEHVFICVFYMRFIFDNHVFEVVLNMIGIMDLYI